MSRQTVVSVGDLVADIVVSIDHFPVEPAAHQLTREIRLEPGGAGNFLIAGARLGLHMIALGVLGDDPFGREAADVLDREGVDLRGLIRLPGTTTTTVIALTDGGGRHVYLGGYGVGPSPTAMALSEGWRAAASEANALFASGYTLHEQRLADAALKVMALAQEKDVPVFFDPGPEMVNATAEQRAAVLRASTAILLTEEEIPLLAEGREGPAAARGLLTGGPVLVCVKRGARGCAIYTAKEDVESLGYPVTARDTSAAGDSFDAAFIYAYLRGWSLADVAAFANAVGAAKVQKIGSGTQVPTADEVRAVLKKYGVSLDFPGS